MENIAVAVADNIIDKNLLFEIITSLIYEDEYSEVLKLKLFDALDSYVKASHKTIDELNLPKDIRNRFQAYISLKELEKQEHKK